ncbi:MULTISPECIES: cytochrome c oxidase subunit 3 [Paracoccus]|uniref:cytochrome c oxidase subunit 3 n=1 Tax=Paracoccus TaxID=265 RepID=UPI001BDB92ED|nr:MULTISPECIES: cytochrome c oxidase subunit 3 [Paracoccus]MBT0779909.1 cytochrome c oxidase subunit 3 [Paracoccus sp. pheM1]MCJ1898833.1 cytochrome c oxidase subunit 3 [Paracoccus versutus]MDF3903239.1 cytochrome c oxidase subunit 3 [Paracoccus sp. AS002]WGR61011.1 cytochrome c oxidase subunit 3 family protein [Paracoccus ferrooxidans]
MRVQDLPGEPIMWVLIASELLVFAAGITAMAGVRLTDPAGFAAAQAQLHGWMAALNTAILVSSGFCAALAERACHRGDGRRARIGLALAALGGAAFLAVKAVEYAGDLRAGLGMESHPFFTFYYLLTGFHAAHVLFGIGVLALVAIRLRPEEVQAGAAFWHMVDLVWVLILPPVYLLG